MLQVNVAQLHEDNCEALALAWVAGRAGRTGLDARRTQDRGAQAVAAYAENQKSRAGGSTGRFRELIRIRAPFGAALP